MLIPKEPRVRGWEDNRSALSAYQAEMRSFSLRYETVLDQIFIQLGGRTFMERALDEIKELYGFPTAAIVSMSDVVECLYNKECQGKVVIDDTLKAAIDAYYEQYGAK